MKKTLLWISALAVPAASFWVGFQAGGREGRAGSAPAPESAESGTWTCSMHPQIRQPGPGRCPICGMDLIPVPQGAASAAGPRRFATSIEALELMEVQTFPVERGRATRTLRLVGRVESDERRRAFLTAWMPGRIEKMYVDFTGATVKAGDPMVEVYSPELLVAQQELQLAKRASVQDSIDPGLGGPGVASIILEATREKLRLWGLTPAQIAGIEERDAPAATVALHAPNGGVVTHREAQVGMYFQTGTPLFTIADLSVVWVQLDAYESDLPWLALEQAATFTAESWPGETFEGKVAFIDPFVDPLTRTVKVRLDVENPGGRLKPEMFVRASVRSAIGEPPGEPPLLIPAAAPLITGKRAIVYVALPEAERPTFEGREIVLGPRADDFYVVTAGLREGERVVTRGNFKIDSALQIEGKASMMRPDAGPGRSGHDHAPPKKD